MWKTAALHRNYRAAIAKAGAGGTDKGGRRGGLQPPKFSVVEKNRQGTPVHFSMKRLIEKKRKNFRAWRELYH